MAKKYFLSLLVIFIFVISTIFITQATTADGKTRISKASSSLYAQFFPLPLKGTILYVSNKNGNWDIFRRNLETGTEENITNNPADDMNPQVSPDGKTVVFYSNRKTDSLFQNANNQIYSLNLVTRELKQLTNDDSGNYDPSFSPDGAKIVFKSTRYDGYGDIHMMNADGTNQINITPELKETEEWDPVFDTTGQKIYFVSRLAKTHDSDEIFMMNTDGTNIVRLTNNTYADWYPSINPQNGNLTYISKKTRGSSDDIFIANPDGQSRVDITNILGNDNDPHWNEEGNLIIFINDHEGDYDMYMVKDDGTRIRKIEDIPGNELSPVFIPEN